MASLRIRVPRIAVLGTILNNLRYGTITPTLLYYGNNSVSKVYLGTNQVF